MATVMFCMPTACGLTPITGAQTRFCARCKAEIWVAPSTMELAEREEVDFVCLGCITDEERQATFEVRDEQVKEIKDFLEAR